MEFYLTAVVGYFCENIFRLQAAFKIIHGLKKFLDPFLECLCSSLGVMLFVCGHCRTGHICMLTGTWDKKTDITYSYFPS